MGPPSYSEIKAEKNYFNLVLYKEEKLCKTL